MAVVDELEEALCQAGREEESLEMPQESADSEGGKKLEENSGATPQRFQSLGEVRAFLLAEKDRFFREAAVIRVEGMSLEKIGDPNIRRFVEYCWHQQQKFPLDTAYAMRGKFKHHRLHLFKRGKKGITYLCAVARKFRTTVGELSPELDRIVRFIETSPMVSPKDVVDRLGESEDPEAVLKSLTWLIREGYVTEFEDGSLLTYPVLPPHSPTGRVSVGPKNPKLSPVGKMEAEAEDGQEDRGDPETDDDPGLRATSQFEMVMDRSHAEDAMAPGELEKIDLADYGKGFQEENAADDGDHEGLLDEEGDGPQKSSDGEGPGVPHENGCGCSIEPEEGDQCPH
jgi:hypothetical protein